MTTTTLESVRDTLVAELSSLGVPSISIVDADHGGRGELLLVHDVASDPQPLDLEVAQRTLRLIRRLWGKPVHLQTVADGKTKVLTD